MDWLHYTFFVVCIVTGYGFGVAYLQGLHDGEARAHRRSINVDCRRFVKALTDVMEVQADGGDSPEAYVGWCVQQARQKAQQEV